MLIELAAGAFLVGSYIYHRITREDVQPDEPELPRIDEGAPIPMLFGRCRVRAPILVWAGPTQFNTDDSEIERDLYFVLGLGFQHGRVINRVHSVWAGEEKLVGVGASLSTLTGDGNHEMPALVQYTRNGRTTEGYVEFMNGKPTQKLVDGGSATYVADDMIAAGLTEDVIPGYRGVLSAALLFPFGVDNHSYPHGSGSSSGLPAYQFEASSYYEEVGAQPLGLYGTVGQDANPMTVIYEVLTATLGKLGLPTSMIDLPSFQAAEYKLYTESHGYSRCWPQHTPASDIINDVLRQIDGFIYEDQRTGKICVRLARNDYNPAELPVINRSNCRRITGFAMNSRTNIVNKVRVVFEDRAQGYADNSASAQNMANAVGQDGQVVEEIIEYRGCKYAALAERLAERELGIRSKPIVKLSAHVSRAFLRTNIGDVVKLVWNAPDINAVFRVVGVDRGAPGDETIRLDLLLDANYVWRNQVPIPPDTGGIDVPPVVLGG